MTERICSIPDCGRKHKGKGFCEAHLTRFKKHGDPLHGGPVVTKGIHSTCTLDGCDNPHSGHGLCRKHIQKQRKYGDPLATRSGRIRSSGEWKAYFYEPQVDTDDCIEPGGYNVRPTVDLGDGSRYASRAIWTTQHGDPGELFVLHTCDNEMCVNLRHLYLGDQRRNNLDSVERGRRPKSHPIYGEWHPDAKLTVENVRMIKGCYALGSSVTELARQHEVSISAISALIRGRTWQRIR